MRRLVLVTALALAALGGSRALAAMDMGGGDSAMVGMTAVSYSPTRVDVLAGDSVTWHNTSIRAHTVTADDGSWSSERLTPDESFSHAFDTAGRFTYHCQIHAGMAGEVDVHELLLDMPSQPAGKGAPYPLTGRAALPDGSTVAIEADSGAGFQRVATATVGADHRFSAGVTPRESASYRAVAGDQASPPVQLLVLDRTVHVHGRRHGRTSVLRVHVSPASPGATVVLKLHLRERFGWWPARRARLDRHSNARFVLRLPRRVSARVELTLKDGATRLARSRTLRVGPPHRRR